MNIDITKLKSNIVDQIDINETISFTEEELKNTGILELKDVKVDGMITRSDTDYNLYLKIYGVMILPCSLTLKPTKYPFSIEINGLLEELMEELEKNIKKDENSLDILPIIWENILMEIPMRVINEEANDMQIKGEGWQLVTEDKDESVNPELLKLKDLLK